MKAPPIRMWRPGRAEVHTLELTELGFSMLGWDEGPRLVFGALLESCFEDVGPSEAEAERLRLFRSSAPPANGDAGGAGPEEEEEGEAEEDM